MGNELVELTELIDVYSVEEENGVIFVFFDYDTKRTLNIKFKELVYIKRTYNIKYDVKRLCIYLHDEEFASFIDSRYLEEFLSKYKLRKLTKEELMIRDIIL